MRTSPSVLRSRCPTLILAFLLGTCVPAGRLLAQTGTIAGQVVSSAGGQPLSAAQVYISELDIGVLTQANGRFILLNVPAGTHTVSVERIGYTVGTATVNVEAGMTVVQNFSLSEEALQLNEVVVTGTAGGSQRRAVGNVVAAVDVSDMAVKAPVTSVEDLLIGRTPGVNLMPANSAGAGSKIRIRGHSSIGLAGDPIIYVDGVRLNDNRTQVGRYSNESRLEDFDPNNIQSIEIIKGPAAATLYGTEAADGVIQIVTKRGQTGAPVFEFSAELGQNYWPSWESYQRPAWAPNPALCTSVPCTSEDQLTKVIYADHNVEQGFQSPWQNGLVQRYNAAVRGGTDVIRYSFSFSRNAQDGVVSWNSDERNSVQANIGVTPSDKINLQLSGGYYQGVNHPPESFWAGEYGWGGIPTGYYRPDGSIATCGPTSDLEDPAVCPNGVLENRGWRDGGPERYDPSRFDHFNASKRSTWSLVTNINLTPWLTHRLTLGMDQVNEREETFYAQEGAVGQFFWGSNGLEGDKLVSYLDAPVYTVDFAGTASFRLMDGVLGTATSYGIQYYDKTERRSSSHGENFAVSALSTVSAASRSDATEAFVENATVGLYVQEQLDWDNRIFVTGAVRGDDNSAFGKNYNAAIYPKLSATWVVAEEPWFNIDWIDQLRVRGAWGEAGKQPDAFAATQLFTPETGPAGLPILSPSQYGNPDLGPEKGEELEVGFDASVFSGRIGGSFTYYHRVTKDAIVGRTVPPSLWPGFAGDFAGGIQFVNIGQTSNWGTETNLSIQAINQGPVRLDLDVAFTTQANRIDDMAGIDRIQVGRSRAHVEGFSIAAENDKKVVSAEFVSGDRGPVTNIMCDGGTGKNGLEIGGPPVPCADAPQLNWGPTDPTRLLNVTPTFTIFDNWRLQANFDAQWGHWMSADYATARFTSHPSTKEVWLQDDPIAQAYIQVTRNGLGYHKAGFLKLREVSLAYTVPQSMAARIGASSANIRIGARNVARLWLQQKCVGDNLKYCELASDPEVTRGEYIFAGEDGGGWPPIPQWTVRLGVTF